MSTIINLLQSLSVATSSLNTIGTILLFYALAWISQRLAQRIARFMLRVNHLSSEKRRWRSERLETLKGLLASSITFLAYAIATLATLSLFVNTDTLVWMIGLFSAAFGLGARPLISDYLTGVGFIFEDAMDVGEKVEFVMVGGPIEGVVEDVSLRATLVRAPSGELLTVPNGEIRVIRNYSRGRFSTIKVKLKIAGNSLEEALPVLEELGNDALSLLPNLLEPWEVVGTNDDEMDKSGTSVTLIAKAKFGQGAKLRPRLLTQVRKRLNDYNIELLD